MFMRFPKRTVGVISRDIPMGAIPFDESRRMMGALSFSCMAVLLCSIGLVVPE
ncbi:MULTISPECIES: hypothetical protein [unclassified Akkermansia]|uniref:hypothetical protein n=1 Tax=unclassified Akkermansia TaxID=2608915 RepID=UPI0012E86ECF|nr:MULTISPECIES: hypothetical protein [unclassified Akkermansia]